MILYRFVDYVFSEKQKNNIDWDFKNLRGGSKLNLFNKLTEALMKDWALKFALIGLFATAGIRHFEKEILSLLTNNIFQKICNKNLVDKDLNIVCNIIKEHDLYGQSDSLKTLIVNNNLSNEQKITLLKIKLDYIINGQFAGKKRFIIIIFLGTVLILTTSSVGGLALILEALYRLFKDGQLEEKLYVKLLAILKKSSLGKLLPPKK